MACFVGGWEVVVRRKRDARMCCDVADADARRQGANERRREKMKALWSDPEWRERVLERRRARETVRKQAESLAKRWEDDEYRVRLSEAHRGREAWNKGKPMPEVTRQKISVLLRGVSKSPETRHKMSMAKLNTKLPPKWRESITNAKKGKTREFYNAKRDYEKLQKDLKLWSESHRARTGRNPRAEQVESLIRLPHLLTKVRKYLALKATLIQFDSIYEHDDPILR